MNEILLTHDEAEDARTKAEFAVWERHGDITELIQAGNEAVLRAQVRKVVEWLEGTVIMGEVVIGGDEWRYIRAAGEGK